MAISQELLFTLIVYGALAAAYLVVIPLALLFYLQARWHRAGAVERTACYAVMFVFFPGVLVFSPFLNFRPQPR
ncbi:MAG: NAD(P)H-quinone oxidoreductase subunit L [Cyanobacteria bacterium REEB459]|nr:NAD(P)H-quinone oxidoreductase subunit L [Cyanobacteria bacterium REEB459]